VIFESGREKKEVKVEVEKGERDPTLILSTRWLVHNKSPKVKTLLADFLKTK
jgi:hypothetical protein